VTARSATMKSDLAFADPILVARQDRQQGVVASPTVEANSAAKGTFDHQVPRNSKRTQPGFASDTAAPRPIRLYGSPLLWKSPQGS